MKMTLNRYANIAFYSVILFLASWHSSLIVIAYFVFGQLVYFFGTLGSMAIGRGIFSWLID